MLGTSFRALSMALIVAIFGSSYIISQADDLQVIEPVQSNAYLTNPGIGWQHFPGVGDQLLPETVVYFDRSMISWRILNPEEGTFDWEVLDNQIEQAAARGQQASFRIYTMRGEEFGGHQLPDWVVDKGVPILLEEGDPNYHSCVYQEEWSIFVEALRERYDGNPDIAYLDISGYGSFNEWNWVDELTEWDYVWEEHYYENGSVSREDMETLDSQARRRLADMFIGGQFDDHECLNVDGEVETVSYDYPGFSETQLIMPYAGVRQSTQYVAEMRADVGFRHDCLGWDETIDRLLEMFEEDVEGLWQNAPVIYEFCGTDPDEEYLELADELLQASHASMVHDNINDPEFRNPRRIEDMMRNVGYRYTLRQATFPYQISAGSELLITMDWVNVGYARSFPSMGQDFALLVDIKNDATDNAARFELSTNISGWMPSEDIPDEEPEINHVEQNLLLPQNLSAGTYDVAIAIMDLRTQKPVVLAIEGQNAQGWYHLGTIEIVN